MSEIADGATSHRKNPKQRGPRRKAVLIISWVMTVAVLLGGAAFGYAYFKLDSNLNSVDLTSKLDQDDRPEEVDNGSLDILVLGSDSRSGDNGKYGQENGARSDTAMIVHLYENRKKASIVSIPRDTLVDRPECKKDDGSTAPAVQRAMFNESYSVGGPACAIKTVEALTDIRMDHFIEVDFSGFKKLIDKLGGVEITTTEAINDSSSHLNLEAGTHTLDGEQALGLVRTRKALGDGSDLGRIQLQQTFIKALMEQVKDIGLFSSPTKLFGLADTATESITTDSDLGSVKDLSSLANSIKGISSKDMQMVTLPVTYDSIDPNRVIPLAKQSEQVWTALKADQPIPESALQDTAGKDSPSSGVVASKTTG